MTFFSRSSAPNVPPKSRKRRVRPATTPTYRARSVAQVPLPAACSTAWANSASLIPSFLHSSTAHGVLRSSSENTTRSAASFGMRSGTVISTPIRSGL